MSLPQTLDFFQSRLACFSRIFPGFFSEALAKLAVGDRDFIFGGSSFSPEKNSPQRYTFDQNDFHFGFVPGQVDIEDFFNAPHTAFLERPESSTCSTPLAVNMLTQEGGDSSSSSETTPAAPNALTVVPDFRAEPPAYESEDSEGEERNQFLQSIDARNFLQIQNPRFMTQVGQISPGGQLVVPPSLVGDVGMGFPATSGHFQLECQSPPMLLTGPMGPQPQICFFPTNSVSSGTSGCPENGTEGQACFQTMRPTPLVTNSGRSTPYSARMSEGGGTAKSSYMSEGENDYVENDSWGQWCALVNWKFEDLHKRVGELETNFPGLVSQELNAKITDLHHRLRMEGDEKALQKQMELFKFVNEGLDRFRQEFWATANELRQQIQQGGGQPPTPSGGGLLRIDVEQIMQNRMEVFDKGFRNILDEAFGNFEGRVQNLHERLLKVSEAGQQIETCSGRVENVHKNLDLLQEHVGQQGAHFERETQRILTECRAEILAKNAMPCPLAQNLQEAVNHLQQQNRNLAAQVQRLEGLFGGQEVPWEKILDLYHKFAEAKQTSQEVRHEMEFKERQVVELLVRQQFEERVKDFQKEIQLDKFRMEIVDLTRNNVTDIANKVFEHIQKGKSRVKKLETRLEVHERECQKRGGQMAGQVGALGGSFSLSPQCAANLPRAPESVPAQTQANPMEGADSRGLRPAPKSDRAPRAWEVAEGDVAGAQATHCFLIDDEPTLPDLPRAGGGGCIFSGSGGAGGQPTPSRWHEQPGDPAAHQKHCPSEVYRACPRLDKFCPRLGEVSQEIVCVRSEFGQPGQVGTLGGGFG